MSAEKPKYSNIQLIALVLLRMLIGWHLLYEGMTKIMNPYWSAAEYLTESQWIFSELFKSIAANSTALAVVNILNEWGLILIGFGLIAGLFTNWATVSGLILLFLYYIAIPPLIGVTSSIPAEGSYLIVNKTLIEIAALFVLLVFPTGENIGVDVLISKRIKKKD